LMAVMENYHTKTSFQSTNTTGRVAYSLLQFSSRKKMLTMPIAPMKLRH
jgi:hypothetical protein